MNKERAAELLEGIKDIAMSRLVLLLVGVVVSYLAFKATQFLLEGVVGLIFGILFGVLILSSFIVAMMGDA